jgi:hypothetical protein
MDVVRLSMLEQVAKGQPLPQGLEPPALSTCTAGESLWTGKYQEGEGAVVVSLGKMSFSEIISCHGTVVNKNCKNQRAGVSRNKLGKGQKGAKTSFAPLMGATVSSEEPRGWVWQN